MTVTVLVPSRNKKYTFIVSGPVTFVSHKLFSPAPFTRALYKPFLIKEGQNRLASLI